MIRSGCEMGAYTGADPPRACDFYAFSKSAGWTKCKHDKDHCCGHESSLKLPDEEIPDLVWMPYDEYVVSYPSPIGWIHIESIPYHFTEDYGKWLGLKRAEYPPIVTVKELNGEQD